MSEGRRTVGDISRAVNNLDRNPTRLLFGGSPARRPSRRSQRPRRNGRLPARSGNRMSFSLGRRPAKGHFCILNTQNFLA